MLVDSKLCELPGWDSLSAISILACCEQKFNVSIPMSKMDYIISIGDLINVIKNQQR